MDALDLSFTPLKESGADVSMLNLSLVSSADLNFSDVAPKRVSHLSTDRSVSTNFFTQTPRTHLYSQCHLLTEESFGDEPSSGFDINRFLDPPHSYFICGVCHKVVHEPIECKSCRNLVCGSCALNINNCPHGCLKLKFLQVNPFVDECLKALVLRCRYEGCNSICTLDQVHSHEQFCPSREEPCASPLCVKLVFGHERYCSATCQVLNNFSQKTKSWKKIEKLADFRDLILHSKEFLYDEARSEYTARYAELEKISRGHAKAMKRKKHLSAQLTTFRRKYHIGKFKALLGIWTCCNSNEKDSVGCTVIS